MKIELNWNSFFFSLRAGRKWNGVDVENSIEAAAWNKSAPLLQKYTQHQYCMHPKNNTIDSIVDIMHPKYRH